MYNQIMDILDDYIQKYIKKVINDTNNITEEYYNTDNLAEVIEKLIILHIRVWNLEDACHNADDTTLADLKRKIDVCFKEKRPKFLQAINKIMQDAILKEKNIYEPSVKFYAGFQNNNSK